MASPAETLEVVGGAAATVEGMPPAAEGLKGDKLNA
jgi:hypothetical protein